MCFFIHRKQQVLHCAASDGCITKEQNKSSFSAWELFCSYFAPSTEIQLPMFTGRSTSSVSCPREDDVCFLVYNETTECKMTLNMRSVKFKLDSIFSLLGTGRD